MTGMWRRSTCNGVGANSRSPYIVRAVTPGTFRMPAVYVEDMYKPRYFARSSRMATVTIAPH